ncbi:MAG TPA: ATP-binding protein [Actinobacteria bacterium]|nr:ATP-binding protein [Actinomycetota bacterium]
MRSRSYHSRLADDRLAELLRAFPAILINGPRATGKTTTARQHALDTVRLDRPAEAAAFQADPDAALQRRSEPLLLDEWQEVPEVLGAVRRAVDEDPRPGRFILTGSVRAEFEKKAWPGTGRLIRMHMHGLTEAEIRGQVGSGHRGFLDRLQKADLALFPHVAGRPTLADYVDMAVKGGFPEVALTGLSVDDAHTWLDSYLGDLITRDLKPDPRRPTQKMREYLEALSLNTAGLPQDVTLSRAVGVTVKTVGVYDGLFEALFITERVPAWTSNRLQRLIKSPKRYIVDSGLAAAAAGLTAASILADGDLLGRVFDTFGTAQLRPEVALATRMRFHHLRTKDGREEIDLVVEVAGGEVLAIEFKASAAPSAADAKHLAWLRDLLGPRFLAGAVMHTGPTAFSLGDRLMAVPVCAIWE